MCLAHVGAGRGVFSVLGLEPCRTVLRGSGTRTPVCWDLEPTCCVRARIVQLAVVPSDTSADKLGFISEQGDEDSLFAFRLEIRHCP